MSRKKKGRALKLQEIRTLLSKLDSETALMVKAAILTGMRQGEQFGLFWEDIDWDRNVIIVQRELFWRFAKYQDETGYVLVKPKSEQSIREIDLSPALRKELRERYLRSDKSGFVFRTGDNTPILPSNVYRRKFRPAVKAAEIQGNVRWHDLRHTFGALKIEQGANIYYVQRQMGHSSIQVTIDVYGHLLEVRKPQEAEKTDKLVFG